MQFTINGRPFEFEGDETTPLLWVIREHLNLTGTKYGCGIGVCGACTVHVNGEAVRACSLAVSRVAGQRVTTIEGLPGNLDHPVQKAWLEKDVPQCGYCQPGMVMAVSALLQKIPQPTDADIDRHITNLCRCASYHRIREAIHAASR